MWCGALALGVILLGSPRDAFAQSDRDRAAARSAADAGADAFEQGRYPEAVELFKRAEQLVHAPTHLLFTARALAKLGRVVEAHEAYVKILREELPANAPAAFKRARSQAESEMPAVAARVAQVTIQLELRGETNGATVQTLMDGTELPAAVVGISFPVDPGVHVFTARSGNDTSESVSVRFDEGKRQTVTLKLTLTQPAKPETLPPGENKPGAAELPQPEPSKSSGSTQKILGFVSLGVGVAATGAATYFIVNSVNTRQLSDERYGSCGPDNCSDADIKYIKDQDDTADRNRNLAIGGFALGAVGLATGIILLVTDSGHQTGSAEPRFQLAGGLNWLGLSTKF